MKDHRQKVHLGGTLFVPQEWTMDQIEEAITPGEHKGVLTPAPWPGFLLIEKHINMGVPENGFVHVSYMFNWAKAE